jgi:hypothetical protein
MVMWGFIAGLGAAVVAALVNFIQTGVEFKDDDARIITTVVLIAIAVLLGFVALISISIGTIRWAIYGRSSTETLSMRGNDDLLKLLRSANDRLLLSDTAKRIAYRQEDLKALRNAIREDIEKGEFDAAMVLVQEMSQTFGYREEAEVFREQINAARAAEMESKISQALAKLDEIIARHDFERAAKEAAKIQRLYPDSERVRTLLRHVVQAREQYKQQLEREFLAAAERDDVDRAIGLLKELDKYLTEDEAEPFRETARGVIGKKRDNLGVQFKLAVHDKEWLRAVQVGEQIIREFPNTRMADEVRGLLDLLRERAAGQQAAHPRTANA